MAALTQPRDTWNSRTRLGDTLLVPMAADALIFIGGMVNVDADGYAVAASDSENHKFAGVCIPDPEQQGITIFNNDGGDDGDMFVMVRWAGRHRFKLALRTPSQDMMMAKVYVSDDQTVAVHRYDVDNDVRCGHIVRLPAMTLAHDPVADFSSDEVEVEISGEPFDWTGDVTTTTVAATTTAAARTTTAAATTTTEGQG